MSTYELPPGSVHWGDGILGSSIGAASDEIVDLAWLKSRVPSLAADDLVSIHVRQTHIDLVAEGPVHGEDVVGLRVVKVAGRLEGATIVEGPNGWRAEMSGLTLCELPTRNAVIAWVWGHRQEAMCDA